MKNYTAKTINTISLTMSMKWKKSPAELNSYDKIERKFPNYLPSALESHIFTAVVLNRQFESLENHLKIKICSSLCVRFNSQTVSGD